MRSVPHDAGRRVVVLGASNVARNSALIVETIRRSAPEPAEILIAAGHGRSYGLSTCVVGRRLSSIGACNLWRAWAARSSLPAAAVVTDVGNDVMYGVPVDVILAWVARCLERFADAGAATTLTSLPLAGVLRLNPLAFYALRTVLFPFHRADFATVVDRARRLDDGLRESADRYRARLVEPRPEWYGLDPIHLRRRSASRAWREILVPTSWSDVEIAAAWSLRVASLRWIADERRLFGCAQRRPQPIATFADGTTLSMY